MNQTNYQLTGSNGRSYPISAAGLTIGRGSTNHVVIVEPQVSRLHARLLFAAGWY